VTPIGKFQAVVRWFRSGYPDAAPRHGYNPLLALCGSAGLPEQHIEGIIQDLGALPSNGALSDVDINVAITKVTNSLPADVQVRQVRTQLGGGCG
jgi:hypothetical protein